MGPQSISRPHCRAASFVLPRILASVLTLLTLVLPALSQTVATTVPIILPSAIAFDTQGNLYLAETANHVVRKIDSAGYITTIAGTSIQGFSGDNGPATAAQMDSPQGLALDTANHLYIADTHNHCIRRLDLATGLIATIAGGSTPGFDGDNGQATSAHLNQPTALAVDSNSSLYIADTQNHRIRKVSSSGIITTIAGDGTQGFSGDGGPATSAELDSPSGLAVDTSQNLYIADAHNNRIRRLDGKTGLITTFAGTGALGFSGDTAQANEATLALPHGLAIDSAGNLYFADTANHRIRRVDATTGTITTVAGNGIQGFSGDAGPATQASLNAPQSPALSPSALVTLADSDNQRVRQISADNTIHTIAGLGTTIPGALSLTGPSVTAYGSGQLTATLATSTAAQGSITFFDRSGAGVTTIGVASITSNAATFDLSALSAGQHNLTATYSGDELHLAAQSSVLSLSVTPLRLIATITPASLLYGQLVPALAGTLAGVLPRDASNLSATFTTAASNLSPVGSYPVTATLAGSAAGNYTVASIPNLTITPAPTVTTLSAPPGTIDSGQPLTLTAHVASTTSGDPTGTITMLDGTAPQQTSPVTSTGDATLTITSLASGTHTLSVLYSGDSNFTRSASTAYPLTVSAGTAPAVDFAITAAGATSQTIASGNSANFSFAVQVQNAGSLSSPITLAATGLPNAATASFNPTFIPPGSPSNSFTLTIAVPKGQLRQRGGLRTNPAFVAVLLLPFLGLRFRKTRLYFLSLIVLMGVLSLTGCGDRIYTGAQSSTAEPFTITVTGTATSPSGSVLQHTATATVTLILQQN